MDIDHIREMIGRNWWRTSDHFNQRCMERTISLPQALEAIHVGDIVQEFPRRKPSPECIICGYVRREIGDFIVLRPLYVLCAVGDVITFISADWNMPREFGQKRRGRTKRR